MALALFTPPTAEPVTLEEAKAHLRVESNGDDLYISMLVRHAREYVESPGTNRALMPQTWDWTFDCFARWDLLVPRPPLQSVTSLKYLDTGGVQQTLSSSLYIVDTVSQPGRITPIPTPTSCWPETFPRINAVTVRFVAGYLDKNAVPVGLKHLILLFVSHWYEHREPYAETAALIKIPYALESLLWQFRNVGMV